MPSARLLPLLGALLCLAATPASAQWTVKKIVFDGKTPWSQQDLEAATGLKPGQHLTGDELKAAANKLNATGDFDDVEASVRGPATGIDVLFKVQPNDPSRRYNAVTFVNFPWWSQQELTSLVHQTVPLFDGTLPEAGDQQDAVTAALQQILLTKQITATITNDIVHPGIGHPKRTLSYRIQSPDIRFASIDIQGASPTLVPVLAKLTTSLNGRLYNENVLDLLLAPSFNAGDLDASLTDLHREVTSPAGHIQVQVSAKLIEGEPYHVAALTFAGSPLVTPEQFAEGQKLHSGDIASRKSLRESLATIDTAYRSQGYMDVSIEADPKLDATTHQASYTVTVAPGEQYRIGTLNVVNLSAEQRKDFDSAWKLTPGAIFNLSYVQNFLKNNTALLSLANYGASFTTDADPDTHLVILTMTFIRGGASVHIPAQ